VLDHLEAAEDVAFGVGQRLALLGGQRLRDALQVPGRRETRLRTRINDDKGVCEDLSWILVACRRVIITSE